jgi:hypothetical protein
MKARKVQITGVSGRFLDSLVVTRLIMVTPAIIAAN